MVHAYGACCGLLLFSAMILSGLAAGNPPTTILFRALIGLFAGVVLGQAAGWVGQILVRDHLPEPPRDEPAEPPAQEARFAEPYVVS